MLNQEYLNRRQLKDLLGVSYSTIHRKLKNFSKVNLWKLRIVVCYFHVLQSINLLRESLRTKILTRSAAELTARLLPNLRGQYADSEYQLL